MTDHYQRSVDQLEEVAQHRTELDRLYATGDAGRRPNLVAAKHDAIRHGLALAKIHATLALVQSQQQVALSA